MILTRYDMTGVLSVGGLFTPQYVKELVRTVKSLCTVCCNGIELRIPGTYAYNYISIDGTGRAKHS